MEERARYKDCWGQWSPGFSDGQWLFKYASPILMFSPSLLPSLSVSLSPSLTLWNCHPVPLCVHMYSDELEERREGRISEPYSVDVLCVAARVECPSLTLRHWEWCLVTHGSCACPVCPSFLCARGGMRVRLSEGLWTWLFANVEWCFCF